MNAVRTLVCLTSVVLLGLAGCSPLREQGEIASGGSELRLPALFSDHMVLQQKATCRIWGWAADGARVAAEIDGQSAEAVAEDGRWQVELPALEVGGPYTLTIRTDDQAIELNDVLVGEVWICSGQSNMEFAVEAANNAQAEIAQAQHPMLRLFTVEKATSNKPLDDVAGQWVVCTPETVGDFSAVGYFFGRDLLSDGVGPVGLIDSTWGGTVAEAWTSMETLRSDPEFAPILARDMDTDAIEAELKARYGTALLTNQRDADVLMADTSAYDDGWAAPDADLSEWETMDLPTLWEEAGLSLDGVVWFRKEVTIPQTWAGQDLILQLSTIDDADVTYFNGTQVGRTYTETPSHWMAPRIYTVPGNLVHAGKNVIAVRVLDTQQGGGIYPSTTPMQIARAEGGRAIDLTGPWRFRIECITAMGTGQENLPARLYNAMVAPLVPYGIRGVIWYQGEANADRAYQYRRLFPALIRDWRRSWGIGDFAFYFVQLANYMARKDQPSDSEWAELREAQTMALSVPHTGMAVTIDIGQADDIHPRDKQTVGKRLALIAQAQDYGQAVEYSGPMYTSMDVEGERIRLHFSHVDGGLVAKNGPLTGFAIAGADRRFYWAQARIENDTVVVQSDLAPNPVAVRYAWADNPACNLYNRAALPASPFRTDSWPGLTVDKE